jgi:hypothetical protein
MKFILLLLFSWPVMAQDLQEFHRRINDLKAALSTNAGRQALTEQQKEALSWIQDSWKCQPNLRYVNPPTIEFRTCNERDQKIARWFILHYYGFSQNDRLTPQSEWKAAAEKFRKDEIEIRRVLATQPSMQPAGVDAVNQLEALGIRVLAIDPNNTTEQELEEVGNLLSKSPRNIYGYAGANAQSVQEAKRYTENRIANLSMFLDRYLSFVTIKIRSLPDEVTLAEENQIKVTADLLKRWENTYRNLMNYNLTDYNHRDSLLGAKWTLVDTVLKEKNRAIVAIKERRQDKTIVASTQIGQDKLARQQRTQTTPLTDRQKAGEINDNNEVSKKHRGTWTQTGKCDEANRIILMENTARVVLNGRVFDFPNAQEGFYRWDQVGESTLNVSMNYDSSKPLQAPISFGGTFQKSGDLKIFDLMGDKNMSGRIFKKCS